MKISIITVVYNDVVNIQKTINSVLEQKGVELEYIVIDGGSTDGTVELIKKNEQKLSYWESKKDNGIYDAMNKAITHVSGDFVAFINSGDWYERDALLKVCNYIKKTKHDIVCCGVNRVCKGNMKGKVKADIDCLKKLPICMTYCHQGIFASKKMFEKHNYNTKYRIAADYDWLLSCFYANASFGNMREVLVNYDVDGISAHNREIGIEESKEIAIQRLQKSNLSKQEQKKMYEDILKHYKERQYMLLIEKALLRNNIDWKKVIAWDNTKHYSIFGSGRVGEECCKILKKLDVYITNIWDNNHEAWGREVDGIIVKEPSGLYYDQSIVIIASTKYEAQIENQLKKQFGRKREQYILYRELRHEIGQKLIKELHLEETKEKC